MSSILYIYELPGSQYRKMLLARRGRQVHYLNNDRRMDLFEEDVEVKLDYPAFSPLHKREVR